MNAKFSYKKLMDSLARCNFVWINYNRESVVDMSYGIQQVEVKLNIPN